MCTLRGLYYHFVFTYRELANCPFVIITFVASSALREARLARYAITSFCFPEAETKVAVLISRPLVRSHNLETSSTCLLDRKVRKRVLCVVNQQKKSDLCYFPYIYINFFVGVPLDCQRNLIKPASNSGDDKKPRKVARFLETVPPPFLGSLLLKATRVLRLYELCRSNTVSITSACQHT